MADAGIVPEKDVAATQFGYELLQREILRDDERVVFDSRPQIGMGERTMFPP